MIVAARSTKLALYTSLQNSILKHKDLLSDREKVLEEAREGLVREGGAVVGDTERVAKRIGENVKDP